MVDVFSSSAYFLKITFPKNSFMNTTSVSNSLDSDQARQNICKGQQTTKATTRERVKEKITYLFHTVLQGCGLLQYMSKYQHCEGEKTLKCQGLGQRQQ